MGATEYLPENPRPTAVTVQSYGRPSPEENPDHLSEWARSQDTGLGEDPEVQPIQHQPYEPRISSQSAHHLGIDT